MEVGRWLRGLIGLLLVVPLASCESGESGESGESDDSADDAGRSWQCSQSKACTCSAHEPGSGNSSNPIDLCVGYNCCLLDEQDTDFALADCDCFDTTTTCEAEAASRGDAVVVSQCPPPGEGPDPNERCAAENENCDNDSLSNHDLRGCCPGTICQPNAEQVPVCRPAPPEEEALFQKCMRAVSELVVVTPTISTSVGTVEMDEVGTFRATAGPGGCLSGFNAHLVVFGQCNLELDVELSDGALRLSRLYGDLTQCPGYSGPAELFGGLIAENDPALVPFEFSFRGLACDPNDHVDYCIAGEFDFHLQGEVDGITFDDQHFVLQGSVCETMLTTECPSP